MDVTVPHLAEGITSSTVVKVLVAKGDKVTKDQNLIELETEKAIAPVPSPIDGIVAELLVAEGDSVNEGQTFIKLTASGAQTANTDSAPKETPTVSEAPTQPQPAAPATATVATSQVPQGFPPPASPSLRKVAAELGIDLYRVHGSGPGGRISREDVRTYIVALQQQGAPQAQSAAVAAAVKTPPLDFSQHGPVKFQPFSVLRKKISEKMAESWDSVVHVTQFDQADMSRMIELRKKYKAKYEKLDARLTLTALLVKSVVNTLKKHPDFNASIDQANQQAVLKEYINIGLAVDTEQGLIVPVIKDADKLSLLDLSRQILILAEKSRSRSISLDDLQGGSFTISNQGGIGGLHFTPIVNSPQIAILGLGQTRETPIVKDGKIVAAPVLPLALSYDHRLIDGGSAARFISELVKQIEQFTEKEIKPE